MNGIDLMNNLIDELNRARDFLKLQMDGVEIPETTAEELFEDIRADLDRYYDVADSFDEVLEDIQV